MPKKIKNNHPLPRIMYVEWDDAMGTGRWCRHEDMVEFDELERYTQMHSIGYFSHETKKFICLTLAVGNEGETSGERLWIPKGCITKRRWVKV